MIEKAYAKINLCLDVVNKRADGYHNLDMIMLPLQLHDTLEISISTQHEAYSDDLSVAMDEHNTIIKARDLMIETYQLKEKFKIVLHKQIPSQAGMAGGSADAAAVMRAIANLCHLDVSIEELSMLGKKVGADVPFCVYSTPAQVQGIGEIVKPFTFNYQPHVLLVKPPMGVSTKEAFQRIDFENGEHPHSDEVIQILNEQKYHLLPQYAKNTLEASAFELVPEIATIKQTLKDMGLEMSLMSGSGSTVFALSEDLSLIQKAYDYFQQKENYFVMITSFL
jgi:4-diphosphocytidyl-2-C-methyl-D-erythritol kinase/energy-coupling factor transport system substrate-specific component